MDKKPPVPGNDYTQGQMMGMLVIIQLLENARDAQVPLQAKTIDSIKRVAVDSLSEYLQKPAEDVILLVNQQLNNI